jgi:hypothetical protein
VSFDTAGVRRLIAVDGVITFADSGRPRTAIRRRKATAAFDPARKRDAAVKNGFVPSAIPSPGVKNIATKWRFTPKTFAQDMRKLCSIFDASKCPKCVLHALLRGNTAA